MSAVKEEEGGAVTGGKYEDEVVGESVGFFPTLAPN